MIHSNGIKLLSQSFLMSIVGYCLCSLCWKSNKVFASLIPTPKYVCFFTIINLGSYTHEINFMVRFNHYDVKNVVFIVAHILHCNG